MSTEKKKFSGWIVVAGCFLISFFIVTVVSNTLALFMAPICQEFGFDTGSYSIITMVGTFTNAIGAMLLAPIFQKKSIKKVMLICGIITGITYGMMGLCSEIWQFTIVFGICNIGLTGVSQLPISLLINKWFIDKRSIALSVSFCGGGIGAMIWAPAFANIITNQGWRVCYYFGGILVVAASIITLLFLVKDSPDSVGQEPYTDASAKVAAASDASAAPQAERWQGVEKKVAFKTPAFFLLVVGIFFLGCIAAGVATHVVNYLVSENGWALEKASIVVSVFSFGTVIAMLVGGVIFDKMGTLLGILFACVCGALGLICLVLSSANPVFAYAYAILFALCLMMPRMLPILVTTAVFGDKDYGAIYSLLNFTMVIGCMFGGVISGVVNNIAGYKVVWIVYIVFCAIVFLCSAAAIANGKKLRELYPNTPQN